MRNGTYHCYLLLLILIASISSNATFPTTEVVDETYSKWMELNTTTFNLIRKSFPCSKPQMRSYVLPHLMQTIQPNPREFVNFPLYIVLNRCDEHSGCCITTAKSCAPVVSKNYSVYIEIEIESLQTNSTRKEWIEVEQHSECTCTVIDEQRYLENKRPKIKILSSQEVASIRERENNESTK